MVFWKRELRDLSASERRFEDIFRIFAASANPNVTIGTYSQKTRIVITGEEILK